MNEPAQQPKSDTLYNVASIMIKPNILLLVFALGIGVYGVVHSNSKLDWLLWSICGYAFTTDVFYRLVKQSRRKRRPGK